MKEEYQLCTILCIHDYMDCKVRVNDIFFRFDRSSSNKLYRERWLAGIYFPMGLDLTVSIGSGNGLVPH